MTGPAGSSRQAGRPARRRLAFLVGILVPAAALVVVGLVAGTSPAGRFQAGLASLVLIVVVGARPGAGGLDTLAQLLGAALIAGLAYLGLGVGAAGALALAFLAFAVGTAAWGLLRLGLALGTPAFAAFAVASLVLWTAMLGLYGADPTSRWVGTQDRRPYRQAVLLVDPALALAYDGAHYDRLRAPAVYFDVPLASSAYRVPRAGGTGLAWLAVGGLASLGAWAFEAGGRSVGRRRSSDD